MLYCLPPHLRYLPENIYLAGIIPRHPPVHLINHVLELVVQCFLEAWEGLRFSRTFLYPLGRDVRAAIFLIICDMLAARQATGFPSSTSKGFCMGCGISVQRIHDLDRTNWPQRDWLELKKHAERWELAATEFERQQIWDDFQIRYSPLNKLPYHDAVARTLPDAMHFGLLNIIPHFLRNVLGIDHTIEGGDGSNVDLVMDRPPLEKLQDAVEKLNACSSLSLFKTVAEALPTLVLRTVCFDNQLLFAGKRAALIDELCSLVRLLSHTHL